MSTSRNMPARFKSRTHLKNTITHKPWNSRHSLVYLLRVVANWRIAYIVKLRNLGSEDLRTKSARYGLASAKLTYGQAQQSLLETRKYRKSTVLPRLP